MKIIQFYRESSGLLTHIDAETSVRETKLALFDLVHRVPTRADYRVGRVAKRITAS